MDPYQGDPTQDPETIQLPDDTADQWTAAVINTPTESQANSIAFLRQKSWIASANWPRGLELWNATQVDGGGMALGRCPPAWNAAYGVWIGTVVDGSSLAHLVQSADGHSWIDLATFTATGPTDSFVYGIIPRPTDGLTLLLTHVDGTVTISVISVYNPATNGVPTATVAALTDPGSGNWYSGGWIGAAWCIWVGNATGATAKPQSSPDGVTWTPATAWSPPSGFVSHNLASGVSTFAGAPLAYIFPAGGSVASSFMASLDGANWAAYAMPTTGWLSGEAVVDATVDAFTGTLYLLSGTGSVWHVWSSSALGTWTLVSTFTHPCYALRANGRELLLWMQLGKYNAAGTPAATYRALASVDAGSTWHPLPVQSIAAPGTGFTLRHNGNQFLYVNTNEYAASLSAPLGPTIGV